MRRGSVSIFTTVSGAIALTGAMFMGALTYMNSRLDPMIAEQNKMEVAIEGLNVKVDFLVQHDGGIVDPIGNKIVIVTSTKK